LCTAPVKSSPPINHHPTFHRPDALPVAEPTASEHRRESKLDWNPKLFWHTLFLRFSFGSTSEDIKSMLFAPLFCVFCSSCEICEIRGHELRGFYSILIAQTGKSHQQPEFTFYIHQVTCFFSNRRLL